jgi:hypothetical protein
MGDQAVRLSRTPPLDVRRQLRKEVGFGCPVDGCGSPYLEWNHFDPPWRERAHHDPDGMIALCAEHHAAADAGAFTIEQLRDMKWRETPQVGARFDWMRNRLLGIVGGNFYYEVPTLVAFRDQPLISLVRDEDGLLLVNVRMLTTEHGSERVQIDDNYWIARGDPEDIECPPSGRLLHARYAGGDEIRIEFFELGSLEDLVRRYPEAAMHASAMGLPITAVEIQMRVGGTAIEFGPRYTRLPGIAMRNSFIAHSRIGLSFR